MSLPNVINTAMMSNSNDERYERELVKRRQEAEARLQEEEEQQWAERRARKEAKVAEKRRHVRGPLTHNSGARTSPLE